jgi:hypothetical protein
MSGLGLLRRNELKDDMKFLIAGWIEQWWILSLISIFCSTRHTVIYRDMMSSGKH